MSTTSKRVTKAPATAAAAKKVTSKKAVPPQARTTPEASTTPGTASRQQLMDACVNAGQVIGQAAVNEILANVGGHKTIGRIPADRTQNVLKALESAVTEATSYNPPPAPTKSQVMGLVANHVALEAEANRLALQTEAAINLGIGMVLKAVGETQITIYPAALAEFTAKHRVQQNVNADGSYTLNVVAR